MVRRDLGGDVDAARLRGPDDLFDRARGRHVADVQARADVLGERTSRAMTASSATAGQPRRPRTPESALVHLRVLGEARLLRVLRDPPSKALTY